MKDVKLGRISDHKTLNARGGFAAILRTCVLGTLETLEDLALFNFRPCLARLLTRMDMVQVEPTIV